MISNDIDKLKTHQVVKFINEYYKGKYGSQRLGQAFMNRFKFAGDSFLFYQTKDSVSQSHIYKYYVI